MYLQKVKSKKAKSKRIIVEGHCRKEQDPDLDLEPSVRDADPEPYQIVTDLEH